MTIKTPRLYQSLTSHQNYQAKAFESLKMIRLVSKISVLGDLPSIKNQADMKSAWFFSQSIVPLGGGWWLFHLLNQP